MDDHFPDSIEALRAGGEACGLYLLALCWCAAHLSDGAFPHEVAALFMARFQDGESQAAKLVTAGLFERVEDGYRLPLFLRDNRSRAEVEADRATKRKRASAGGKAKAAKDAANGAA